MTRDADREKGQAKLLEEIIELTPVLICVVDSSSGAFVMVNDQWHAVLGLSKHEMLHKPIVDFLHPEDRESTQEVVSQLQGGQKILHFVNRYRTKAGDYRTLEWRAHIHGDQIYGAARDITLELAENRRKQQELDFINLLFEQTLTGMFTMMLSDPISWKDAADKERLVEQVIEDSRIVRVNQAFLTQFHASERQMIGMRASELFRHDLPLGRTVFRRLLEQGKISQKINMRRMDGSEVSIEGEYHTLYNEQGEIIGYFGMQLDVTEKRKSEQALERSERMYRLITEYASDVIWVYSFTDQQFTYMSPSVQRFIGYTPEEIVGRSFEFVIHPDHVSQTRQTLLRMLKDFRQDPKNPKQWTFQVRHITKDGASLWADASVNFRLRSQGQVQAIGVSRDISTRKEYEEKILHLSYRDQLTGLYNRRYFEEQLEILTGQPESFPISILVCDVNGLKLTNDVFGHQTGDRLLCACAQAILAHSQKDDVVARIGGDEYVVLMKESAEETARSRIQAIQQEITEKRIGETRLSVSFGCATAGEPGISFEAVFKQAEDDMYRQKLMESSSYKHDLIKILIRGLYEKGDYERCHSERVAELSYLLGKQFAFSDAHLSELRLAGMLHDIGKIGISSNLLNQKRPLNDNEWNQVHRHPELGYHILRSVHSFERMAEWVLAHHEQPDGKGYPRGLKNGTIPIEARIIAIANAYDAMTSEYGYRNPLSVEEAQNELRAHAGTQFDAAVVDLFLHIPISDLKRDSESKEAMYEQLRPS